MLRGLWTQDSHEMEPKLKGVPALGVTFPNCRLVMAGQRRDFAICRCKRAINDVFNTFGISIIHFLWLSYYEFHCIISRRLIRSRSKSLVLYYVYYYTIRTSSLNSCELLLLPFTVTLFSTVVAVSCINIDAVCMVSSFFGRFFQPFAPINELSSKMNYILSHMGSNVLLFNIRYTVDYFQFQHWVWRFARKMLLRSLRYCSNYHNIFQSK